jgi:hypothetical protein
MFATVFCFALIGGRHLLLSRRASAGRTSAATAAGPRSDVRLGLATLAAVALAFVAISGSPEALDRSVSVVTSDEASTDPAGTDPAGTDPARPSTDEDGNTAPSSGGNSGVGTFYARSDAWGEIVDWIHRDGPSRALLGVGFGAHYLQLSGGDVLLLGSLADPDVRAAHNFGVNTWARLGAIGLAVVGLIMVLAIVAAVRLVLLLREPPLLDVFAALLVLAIPTTALLGVVLESPFGAIPYFWAVGYLGARMVQEGLWRPLPMPARLKDVGAANADPA